MANIALRAARKAGQHIVRGMDRLESLHVTEKAANDFVSNIDQEAEALIVDALHDTYPNHGIRGEENGQVFPVGEGDNNYNWIIDPLDGTLNYLQGIPHFCVSIGVMKGKQLEHGVIVDPLRNEEFVASRGHGAHLNGKRIRVGDRTRLNQCVLATGIPPGEIKERLDPYIASMYRFTRQCRGIRRAGSAALDMAYVAAGRADGFWEMGLQPWDIAAGVVLVREAGGFVGDLRGGDNFMASGDVVAANPKLFKLMVHEINQG